jgi:hypothetical protein
MRPSSDSSSPSSGVVGGGGAAPAATARSCWATRCTEIPLTQAMADALRELRPDDPRAAQGPVFADRRGRPPRYSTVFNRV